MSRPSLLTGLALCLGLLASAHAAPMSWNGIRDGSLYLQPDKADTLTVSWEPAWQADAHKEHLYLLDGQGKLRDERVIRASESRGRQSWPLPASTASYRLEIPGYSFRRYQLEHDQSTVALFAPAKVHFSVQTAEDAELYFKVGAGEQAVLAGKFHDGVSGLQAERLKDGKRINLALKSYPAYWQFDQAALPVAADEQVWRLRLQGSGKAAFWLDGTANLFAQQPQQLQPLLLEEGHTRLSLHPQVLGQTPRLGVALPYEMPPQSAYSAIDALQLRAAGYYSLVDLLTRDPHYEDRFRRLYHDRFGITQDITLLAGRNRKADLLADSVTSIGLNAWLAATVALGGKGLHYIAFADEPNLNYNNYATYQGLFDSMARQVRDFPGAYEAGVRIAMPASSRLVNGPLHEGSSERRGIDWARRLLEHSPGQIDAMAWHEWMVRDLLATRSYRDSVRQAAELVGLDPKGRPRKALLLDQTNISSGSSLSPYEQETHFASMWWASVVINAAQDGLLDMLNFFHVADEPEYPKGMLRQLGPDSFELKPVGLAQQFIQSHWLGQVLRLDNDAFEVDALAMANGQQRSLLGVNKAARLQHVSLQGPDAACPQSSASLVYFGADSKSQAARYSCLEGLISFEVPGETLFALTWSAS